MKVATVLFAIVLVATTAWAEDPAGIRSDGPTNLPDVLDAFYCQQPQAGWNAMNASNAFNSEMADDIPNELAGSAVTQVTFYVAQWAGNWRDPESFVVNFYDGACPPNMNPTYSFTIPWGQIDAQFVYQGSWYVKEILVTLPEAVTLTENMSIGGLSNVTWGQNAPYTGLCLTDDYVAYGCGSGYWAGDHWGYPRWTPFSSYFGYPIDLAYCLHGGPIPIDQTSWGQVKALYR